MQLPPWMPEWVGADELADRIDADELRAIADAFVDLVFDEATVLLDSLPEDAESTLVGPMGYLTAARDHGSLTDLVAATRLVRRCMEPYLPVVPGELAALIRALPE